MRQHRQCPGSFPVALIGTFLPASGADDSTTFIPLVPGQEESNTLLIAQAPHGIQKDPYTRTQIATGTAPFLSLLSAIYSGCTICNWPQTTLWNEDGLPVLMHLTADYSTCWLTVLRGCGLWPLHLQCLFSIRSDFLQPSPHERAGCAKLQLRLNHYCSPRKSTVQSIKGSSICGPLFACKTPSWVAWAKLVFVHTRPVT